jgi:hypothetical protein
VRAIAIITGRPARIALLTVARATLSYALLMSALDIHHGSIRR